MNAKMLVPDRPTLALASAVGVAYLVLGAPLPLALITALLVCFARGVLEAALSYRRTPRPRPGTPEAMWIGRAEAAVASIRRLRASAGSGAVAYRSTVIASQAADAVVILRRLAYQSDLVARITERSDPFQPHPALPSLRQPHGPGERLRTTHRDLVARIESATVGLEGLVAQLAEIVALTAFSSPLTAPRVDELASELDTLRAALVETEDLSRHALTVTTREGG